MDQFVLIPQQLYEQKIKFSHRRLDKYNEKQQLVPKYLETVYKKVNAKTKSSSNESIINVILSSPSIKLSLSDSVLLDGGDTSVAFLNFVYVLKRKNFERHYIYYTSLDAIGLNPKIFINKDAKRKERGSWIPFKSERSGFVKGRKSRIWFSSKPSESQKNANEKLLVFNTERIFIDMC